MNVEKLFKKINPNRLAKIMDIPASTIYSWKKSGVPAWRTDAVVEACQKLNIDISDCMKGD